MSIIYLPAVRYPLPPLKDASADIATIFSPTTTLPLLSNEREIWALSVTMGGRKMQVGQKNARGYRLGYPLCQCV